MKYAGVEVLIFYAELYNLIVVVQRTRVHDKIHEVKNTIPPKGQHLIFHVRAKDLGNSVTRRHCESVKFYAAVNSRLNT